MPKVSKRIKREEKEVYSRRSGRSGGNSGGGDTKHHGIQFNKSFGQHILNNPLVIDSIIDKAVIRSTDVVLEIGPGTGNMTVKMLQRAKKVIAVELDPRMVVELKKRVQGTPLESKLQIIHQDFMKLDPLPYFDLCVANVPYQISSGIVFKLLAHNRFRCAVLMFQREFAMRLVAQQGSNLWCRLASNCQLLAKCEHVIKVSRNSFKPPPKVDSSVVRITPRNPPPPVNFTEWDGMTRLAFTRKNKKLVSIFKNKTVLNMLVQNYKTYSSLSNEPMDASFVQSADQAAWMRDRVESILRELGMIDERAAKLSNNELLKMLTKFNENKIHFS